MDPVTRTDEDPAVKGKSGGAFALALALLLPAGLLAQVASPLAGLLWTEPFVFLVPAVVATAGCNLDARRWLRLRRATVTALATSALIGAAAWFLGSALFAAVRAVSPASLVARFDLARIFEGPPVERLAFAVAASVVAPLCEEVTFRGHLASALHSRHGPPFAIGVSATLFALFHLDPLRAPSLLLLGALYGWLAWRTGSIWPSIVAHAVNNGIASALALTFAGGAEVGPEPSLRDALVGVAIGAAAVAAAVSLFRAANPSAAGEPGLPLADPAVPETRFRLSRVPRPLLWAVGAGWLSLGALLLPGR